MLVVTSQRSCICAFCYAGDGRGNKPRLNGAVIAVQLLALITVVLLFFFRIAPALAILVFAILFVRAVSGLLNQTVPKPKKLGISEVGFGAMAVLAVGTGYRLGW